MGGLRGFISSEIASIGLLVYWGTIAFHEAAVGNTSSYILAGDYIVDVFSADQRSMARGRTRYLGCEFVSRPPIVHDQGEGLDIGKYDSLPLSDALSAIYLR
jgi:hypothetical protein